MKTKLIIIALMLGAIATTLQAQNYRHNIYTSESIEREDNKMYQIIEKHYPDIVTDKNTIKRERIEYTKTFIYTIPRHLYAFYNYEIDHIMHGKIISTQEVSWFMIYDYIYDRHGVQKEFSWFAWRLVLLAVLFMHILMYLANCIQTRTIANVVESFKETYSENILIMVPYVVGGLIAPMVSEFIFYDHSSSSVIPLVFAYILYGIIIAGVIVLLKSLYQRYTLKK